MFYPIFEELKKYKKLIIAYVMLCMVISVFVSPFFGTPRLSSGVSAADVGLASSDEELVPVGESIDTLNVMFTKGAIKKVAGAYAPVVGTSCEPFTALLYIGVLENINKLTGNPLDIASTPAGNPVVLIVILLFFIASKVMKCNEATKVFGLCTLGELEKFLGLAFVLVLGIVNVVGLTDFAVGNAVNAASAAGVAKASSPFIVGLFTGFISVLMAVGSMIIYIIIRTVMFGLDALQSCFSFVPASGLIFEIIKSFLAIAITTINVFFPYIALVVDAIVLIICIILFGFFYRVEEFVRRIFIKPFISRIKGFNDEIPLISKKLPKRYYKYVTNNGEKELKAAILTFAYRDKEADAFKVKFMKKAWLIHDGEEAYLISRRHFKFQKYPLTGRSDDKKYYLKKEFRFIELFSAPNPEKLNKRDMRFMLSVEYSLRFEEICELFGFENYHVIKENIKLTKKQARLEKREELKEKGYNSSQKMINNLKSLYHKLPWAEPEAVKVEADNHNNIESIQKEREKWPE